MKEFEYFNTNPDGKDCPVCNTKDDKPCVLIPIDGTEEGNKEQAIQVHTECIDLRYKDDMGLFYQKL